MTKIKTGNRQGIPEDRIEYIKKLDEERIAKYNDDFLKSIAEMKEYELERLKKEIERRRNTSIFERWRTISKNPSKWW